MNEPTMVLREQTDWEALHETHVSNRTVEGQQALRMAMYYFAFALGCLLTGIAVLYFGWRQFHGG